jgi:hypothetical protein
MGLGPVALSGRHLIDDPIEANDQTRPHGGLGVEWPVILHPEHEDAEQILATTATPEMVPWDGFERPAGVWLRIAGVPYAGHLDLYNHRGYYIDPQGDARRDVPGTLECKDWKTTSNLQYAKNPEQVANAIPMTGYAMAGFAMWPEYDAARLTHVYFSRGSKSGAMLSTARRTREQVERRWEYAVGIVRSILDLAPERDPNKIPVNTKACWSYNSLCPHFSVCPRGRAGQVRGNGLQALLGPRMAAQLDRSVSGVADDTDSFDIFAEITEEKNDMGLLKKVGQTTAASAAPTPTVETVSIEDLLAEEIATRDATENERESLPPRPPTDAFVASWATIEGSGLGTPTLKGLCASMLLTSRNEPHYTDSVVEGTGKLAKLEAIIDPIKLNELARQIAAKTAKAAAPVIEKVVRTDPAPIALLPPDAPKSNPALAADPVEGLDNAKTRELAAARGATPTAALTKIAPSAGPEPQDLIAADASVAAPEPVPAKPRGRPPGSKNAPKADPRAVPGECLADVQERAAQDELHAAGLHPLTSYKLSIYIDVIIEGVTTKNLNDYVSTVASKVCKAWDCTDVRLAGNDTQGGSGKGPIVLSMLCVDNPPEAGVYVVDSRGNALVEQVAIALRAQCLASGGVFVRGVK